jgi:hypothetical protein
LDAVTIAAVRVLTVTEKIFGSGRDIRRPLPTFFASNYLVVLTSDPPNTGEFLAERTQISAIISTLWLKEAGAKLGHFSLTDISYNVSWLGRRDLMPPAITLGAHW